MTKYRRVFQSFNDLEAGLLRAQNFYSEMKETVSSLQKNVESFVQNRRAEGGQLLTRIEQSKSQGGGADLEQQRLKDLMDRMSMDPVGARKKSVPPPLSSTPGYRPPSAGQGYNSAASPPVTPRYPITTHQQQQPYMSPQQSYNATPANPNGYQQPPPPRRESYQSFGAPPTQHQQQSSRASTQYNPNQYNPVSPPAHQQFFSPPPAQQTHQQQQPWGQPPQQQWGAPVPQGYVPPPPPPGPPPAQADYSHFSQGGYPSGPGGYAGQQGGRGGGQGQGGQNDPWAGLSGWK